MPESKRPRKDTRRKNYTKPTNAKLTIKRRILNSFIFSAVSIVLISFIIFFGVMSDNNLRRKVLKKPAYSSGKITINITKGRGSHYAAYNFIVNGKQFEGKSFHQYSGFVGDSINVIYNADNPNLNITAEEQAEDSVTSQILPVAFITLAINVVYMLYISLSAWISMKLKS